MSEFIVSQLSKSRWIVSRDGKQISKHGSRSDAERSANNYRKAAALAAARR